MKKTSRWFTSYLPESDAIASAKQVRVAAAKAKLIKAGRRLKTGLTAPIEYCRSGFIA